MKGSWAPLCRFWGTRMGFKRGRVAPSSVQELTLFEYAKDSSIMSYVIVTSVRSYLSPLPHNPKLYRPWHGRLLKTREEMKVLVYSILSYSHKSVYTIEENIFYGIQENIYESL